MQRTLLVVDDESAPREILRRVHELEGWTVLEASSGREAMRVLYERKPDVVTLDVQMDEGDGWEALERIRDVTDVPVMMLSGNAAELDKVRALRCGADDYVTKPFSAMEVVARSEALLRRRPAAEAPAGRYEDGLVVVDQQDRSVTVGGREVVLTPQEFRLLGAFVRHPRQVLSPQQLLELAWDSEVGTRDQVKVYVGYLRRKLGCAGACIETLRGFGYRFRPATAA